MIFPRFQSYALLFLSILSYLVLQFFDGEAGGRNHARGNVLGLVLVGVRAACSSVTPLAAGAGTTPVAWDSYVLGEDPAGVLGAARALGKTAGGDQDGVDVRRATGLDLRRC